MLEEGRCRNQAFLLNKKIPIEATSRRSDRVLRQVFMRSRIYKRRAYKFLLRKKYE
ncbi:hypothetical protein J31TS6_34770 [Brevibacillus reuszeri]|nr:hypothetical protein J31TS6_34770 [Brevibacillus reuszeri]